MYNKYRSLDVTEQIMSRFFSSSRIELCDPTRNWCVCWNCKWWIRSFSTFHTYRMLYTVHTCRAPGGVECSDSSGNHPTEEMNAIKHTHSVTNTGVTLGLLVHWPIDILSSSSSSFSFWWPFLTFQSFTKASLHNFCPLIHSSCHIWSHSILEIFSKTWWSS